MKNAFVIGHPIAHSKSPLVHGHWLQLNKIAGEYKAIDVAPEHLAEFAARLKNGSHIGGNVTVPHKEAIMPLCDEITETAKNIGAVNTLWMQDGRLCGDNTDKYGFLANLDQQLSAWDEKNDTAIVLGAGGAARAILVGLIERGYQKIYVVNRTIERAQVLCAELNKAFAISVLEPNTLNQFNMLSEQVDLVVNSSAVGMGGSKFEDLSLGNLPKSAVVTDIVYTPLETPLLADARDCGLRTIDGVGMLLHQAVPGFERWFGVRPTVTKELRQILLEASK